MACKAILYKGQNNQIEFDITDNHATLDAFLSKQYSSYFSNKLQSINENIDISHNLVLDYDDVLESNGRQTELSKEIAGKIKSGELSADKVFVATARTDNEKGTQQKDIADSLGIPVENVKLNVYGQAKADFVKGLEGDSTFIDNDKTNTDAVAKVGGRTILLPTESKRTVEAIQKDIDGLNSIIAKSKGKSKAALQEELDVLHKELEGVAKTEPTKSEVKKQEPAGNVTKETTNLKRQRTKKLKEVQAKIDTIKKELEGISNTKRNAKKIAGLNDQITTLERERVSIIEEYDNKIKALTESKTEEAPNIEGGIPVEDITKINTNEKEEVQKTQEVKVEEPVEKKTGSTSISQKVRNKIKTYFDKLVGKDTNLITVSTAKLEEISKSRGFDSFKAMVLGWHGSKTNFDKFSLEFAGQGEGNWEFGWGAYFSSLKDIASGYGNLALRGANRLPIKVLGNDKVHNYYVSMTPRGAKYYKEHIATYETKSVTQKEFETNVKGKAERYLYKANIQDNFIDYSKEVGEDIANDIGLGVKSTDTGFQAYNKVAKSFNKEGRYGGYKEASLYLLEKGYNGIKFPAESISRGKTSDTARGFNYVVFDENAITIDEKIRFLSTPSGKIYGLFIEKDVDDKPHIYLSDDFTTGSLLEEMKHFQYFTMKIAAGQKGKEGEAAGKIIKEAKRILKPIVDKVIAAQGKTKTDIKGGVRTNVEPTPFVTRDGVPIGFQYDTEQVARERFDFSKLKQIGKGSDRTVFDLGDGRALKVAHTARGLAQNVYEGDYYLKGVVPEVYERGLNYVVVDNVPKAKMSDKIKTYDWDGNEIGESTVGEMLKSFSVFRQDGFDKKVGELQDALVKYGFQDVTSYDVLWEDFHALRNWGYKDGAAIHTDGGTFGGVENILNSYRGKKPLSDHEFREIYNKSKQVKKELRDTDKYTKFSAEDPTNRNTVLQEIKREYGIDLMSEVYKQQKNESDEAYQDRIFDEVWAKITVAEGEKDIKANYTFWNKVKELLGKIQEWFANSLGLKDQDLSKLTPYELGKQSFNSLMKGEFITSEPVKLNTRERELGVFVDSADDIFARIPQEIQEFLTKQTKWNGVKSIPIPILKRLAGRKLSLTEKFLMIGKEVSIFKQELSIEQIERFADAEMEGVVSYKDHAELADYYINSIDTANITLSPNTHTDLRVMDRLFHYFMNHKGVDSQRIVVELSVRFDKIASALGGLMWAISPKGSLTAITNEMIIRSHGRMFSDFLGTKTYKEMKAEMDKVVDQLAMTKEELDEVKQKLRKLTDNKTTNKATLIKSGFVQRDEQSAIRKVMNSVGIAKSTSKVPKASAIRFSAEPINDVEEALANLLLTDYLKEGNLLQAKGRYEKQLEQLKNVDGENVYERLVANLPANYDLVNDLAKSKIFTELRSKEDKIAAIAVIEDRILGKKEGEKVISKPIHQRISFDFVDNFIKDLFSRVYPITNITISKQHLDAVNITDIDNPTGKESSEAYVLFEYYDKIKAAVELYNTGKSTLYEMDNEVKKLNAAMQKQLSKFSIFTDIFPSFDIVYEGNSPIDGSVQRFRGNRYVYDGTSKEWNRVNDFRKVPKEIQDKLNVAYLSKAPISEKYLASALDKFKSMVDDPAKSEELEDIIISTYQAFLNRGYNKHHIRDIENMLYNAYGIDVTGVVGIRNLVENDLALFNATLDEVVEDIYSINTAMWNQKGGKLDRTFAGYNSLTEALADRLGIDEYNGIQIEEAVKAFLTHEIYPNKEKALANFKKSTSDAVVKESVRLAINGKLSPLDLFPIFASKYNKKIGTPEAFRQYSKLVKDWEDAETNMEKKNARIALQQFFINHKNDGWVKPIFEAIIQYGVVAYFGANVLLVSQLPGIATLPERILMYPAVLTHNMLASKDGRISGKEMKSLLLKVFSSSYVELAGKGIPEILDVLVTGKGKVTYMSEDNRLQRETAIDKVLINYINDSIANAYNHIKYGIVNLSPIINMKEGDKETQLFIDKNHPLHNVKTILTDAIRIDPNNTFSTAIDIINEKIAELNSIGRDLYKNERLSKKQYEEAIVFLEANKNYVASSRLLTKAEINKEILKDSKRLATSLVLSAAATLYRAKTFPVIADIITRMIVSPQDVAWETYFQKRKTPNGEGELMKSVLDALGEVKEVDEQLKEEGYGNDILGDLSRRAEIKEGYRGSPVWDLVARSTGQLTQMERTRDVAGLLSNTLSDLINNTQMFDPSRYEGGMKELVGLAWGLTKLTEVIFIPFVLKVGTNVFNFAKYYIPLGLPAMLTLKGGVNIATRLIQRNNINPQDWVIKDGVWVNKSMTITKDPNNIATSYIVSKDNKIIDSYPTLHEAKIMAGKVNNIVLPDGYMKYIDPFKSFRGKLNLEGKGGLVKIEEEFDLSPVDKYKLVFRSLQGTMIFLYMFMQMWDFDEDEKTGKMVAVKRRDSAWELVGNESNNFTADRLIKREPNTLRLDLNKTGLGRLGLKNLPIMQARLADLPFSPALGGLVELENDVYNSQNIYTDEATPKHVFDNSMSAVLGVFRDATIRSMQMAAHQMFFNSLAEFGGLVSSINRYEPVDKNTDGYKADRATKNMLRKPSQFLLRMAAPNFQKDINSVFGGNMVSSTNKTLKPLADVMNTPQLYMLSTADKLYNGVSTKSKSYLSEWVTSELAGTIGIKDILGIQGDFDDNFSYITRSARGSIMKNVPATKSIDIVRLPFDEISEFDKWGIDNGISAAYKYTSESGTKHITTPNDNTKLRKYVDTKATEIVNKIFVDNIDMFNKKLADIPEVAGKYDHGYNIDLKDNTATIREIKQKFNDAIIQKSHDIALVLGVVEMIKLNPDNSALLQENVTKKFIPKSWVSDDYSTLDISAFESDPSELSYEYAIDASDKATLEEQLYLSLNTDITINGKTYKNLSVAKLKGVLDNIAGKLNNKDKTFWEKGVLLNSNNKLIAKRY